jgi:bifunctional non-homologous end joining protein LigD
VIREGRTNFSELQAELAAGRQDRLEYYAFDLLYLDGYDLRKSPQFERKRLLKELIETCELEAPIHYSDHLIGDGQQVFEHASKLNWEGIVSKDARARYKSERGEAWLKVKTVQRGRFLSSALSKTLRVWRHCTSVRSKGKNWSTWARSAPVGRGRFPAKLENSSTPW